MRISILSSLALASILPTAAAAADFGVPAPPTARSWTGVYVGGIAGYSAAEANIGLIPGGAWLADNEATFLSDLTTHRLGAGGFTGGGTIGYNRQFAATLVGVEADFSATLMRNRRQTQNFAPFPVTGDTYIGTSSFSAPWLSTVRGRVGLISGADTLVYLTGGLALAKFDYTNGYIFGLGPGLGGSLIPQVAVGRAARVNVGWTLGAGIEQALGANWSVKAEYLYADLGRGGTFGTAEFINGVPTNNGYITENKASLQENVFRLGLNYRLFGG